MAERSLDPTARIVELETSLAFQQRLCEQLNQIVSEHSRQIMTLQRSVNELNGRLKEVQQQRKEAPIDPLEEKPPHY